MSENDSEHHAICVQIMRETGLAEKEFRSFFVNSAGYLLGFGHIDLIDSLEMPPLHVEQKKHLRLAYVYFASALFSIDRLVDRQSSDVNFDLLTTALSISLGFEQLAAVSCESDTIGLFERVSELMRRNRAVLTNERLLAESDELENHAQSAYERAYLFVAFYQISAAVKSVTPNPAFSRFCRRFLYFMQEGDDLGDWREDFFLGKITPFLRNCYKEMGRVPTDISELEEFVYLSGIYETQAVRVENGLRTSLEILADENNMERLVLIRHFVDKQANRISEIRRNFELVKAGQRPIPLTNPEH